MKYRIGGVLLVVTLAWMIALGVGILEKRRAELKAPEAANLTNQPNATQPQAAIEPESEPAEADIRPVYSNIAAKVQPVGVGSLAVRAAISQAELSSTDATASEVSEPTIADPEIDKLVELMEISPARSDADEPANDLAAAAQDSTEGVKSGRKPIPEPELDWNEDYQDAWKEAAKDGRMLFIYFHDVQMTAARRSFEMQTLARPEIKAKLAEYVLVDLPVNAVVKSDGRPVTLLKHPAFAEMQGRSGIAIVDLAHRKANYYKYVVSTFPFTRGKYYRGPAVETILSLPPGTLTQRTMIYAVRTHPEAPASTQGNFNHVLAEEAKLQSDYQAQILVQGHHNWENRFHRINARLPGGATAQEVVAESWPNESLVDACVDCVDSWRHSPGHWNAVRSRHPLFGFDIKLGRNGIWYATGIFGRR